MAAVRERVTMVGPPLVVEQSFLFTDVEGSARLWESDPEGMEGALADHFRLLREEVSAQDGTVVKDTGDGVFAVFATARGAVAAAVSAQQSLVAGTTSVGGAGPLRVRMGIHTGRAVHEEGDYHGTAVNRCARLMGIAHGGQVLVSESTHGLVCDDPPLRVSFKALGVHRLKDLARPEVVHQVVHPDLPTQFPPLRSLEAFAHNLPAELSSFVGRAEELAAVQAALDRSRLVTLTGAGGSGKTRLALQVAADRVEQHPDGVWLVDLAGLSDPELVPQATLAALRAPEHAGRGVFEALSDFLVSRDLLLVVDNCEHLIDAAAELADRVLRAAPQVRLLATSREPLNVAGEVSWRVPSLSLPQDATPADAVSEGSEAVALFVERAQAADPGFELTPDNLPAVAAICRRLDGLPLAIELAAARMRGLSVEDLAARVHDRFALLTGGTRTALPRQRTLEATVAWSYDLLGDDERRLFARLSVFAGTFTLDTVEEVCAGHALERGRIVDLLTALVDKSLVAVHLNGGPARYRLLETLRDYARKRLAESSDREAVRAAHRRWAVAYAEAVGRQLPGPQQKSWTRDTAATADDLRAAIEHAIDDGDVETALRIVVGLDLWYTIGNSLREGRRWLDRLLPLADGANPGLLGRALSLHGWILGHFGETDRAVAVLERSLTLLSKVDDPCGLAFATLYLAVARWRAGEPQTVRELLHEAVTAFDQLSDPFGLSLGRWLLILWELEFGQVNEAAAQAERYREYAEHMPAPLTVAHASEAAALVARAQRDLREAQRHFGGAIQLYGEIGDVTCLAHCLEHTALWALDTAQASRAASLLGAAEALRDDIGGPMVLPFEGMWHDTATAAARKALGDEAFTTAWQHGRELDLARAIRLGLDTVGAGRSTSMPRAM
ncbi:MAG: adenylate/guanylate cyclase domain-containing protein [Actinomycetota bacterium]|nr:adenylate/guanylate cyclase domain-containing protein [Actinomycetota bacterium]